jgi:hypothetical protein
MTSSASETTLTRMARAIYAKAEQLGISTDPEGGGDLSRAVLLCLAGLDAIEDLSPWAAMRGATACYADEGVDYVWQTILETIKGGKA